LYRCNKNLPLPTSVIFDCERMKYQDTGLYHYCLNLGNHLQKAASQGPEEIHFYTPYGTQPLFGNRSKHLIQTELHKICMPDLKGYRIWHATHQDSYYLPFRNRRIKVVLTIHDLNFLYDHSKSEAKKQKYLRRVQMLINRADAIVCVSEYCKKDVLFYCDINDKPLYVIHNGTNALHTPRLDARSYQPVKPFLFSLGTVVWKKNFHTLLPLVHDDSGMELVIAGRIDDAGYHNYIMQAAEQLGVLNNIRIIGQVNENEKAWYFRNCTAFAFPSISEGFGLPVAEAMSVGKPLFLSDKTALPEIAGNAAFYFKDFSATRMREIFYSGMKQYSRLNMQEDIMEKGKAFCWNKAANEYLNVYRSL